MKGKIFGGLITIILSFVLFFVGIDNRVVGTPIEVYQVYLEGKKIGLIDSKDKLLNLIDSEQNEIKEKYNVDKVYPPNGLDIQKVYTYDTDIVSVESIYNEIKDIEPFTIEGYRATIKYTEKKISNDGEITEPGEPVNVYMLDKNIMKDALYSVATAFIGTEEIKDYENGTQSEITETGEIINSIYYEETITIKKDLVSTEEYIFKDVDTLSRYLLFGTLATQKTYVTKEGENLEAIADANRLNIEELLIANPQYQSANVLLTPGEVVNIGLIKPLVSVVYRKTEVSDVSVPFKVIEVKDNTKYRDYEKVTNEGSNGLTRITSEIKYINGEIQNLTITNRDVLVNAVDKTVVIGTKSYGTNYEGAYNNDRGNAYWSWPTISPFLITSGFKWRWGRQHAGIDIATTDKRSPIYAVNSGKVYKVNYNKSKAEGLSVYIDHGEINGTHYVTVYMHLSQIMVKEGQNVKKEQQIGRMGATGVVTGAHLHLGVYIDGLPYQGGKAVDACKTIFSC